jgi:hypothetical protein
MGILFFFLFCFAFSNDFRIWGGETGMGLGCTAGQSKSGGSRDSRCSFDSGPGHGHLLQLMLSPGVNTTNYCPVNRALPALQRLDLFLPFSPIITIYQIIISNLWHRDFLLLLRFIFFSQLCFPCPFLVHATRLPSCDSGLCCVCWYSFFWLPC